MFFPVERRLVVAAAAASAIGLVLAPASAQAYPPAPLAPGDCTAYQFPSGTITLNYPGIGRTVFDIAVPSPHVDTKATTFYDNGTNMPGSVTGDVKGTAVNLTVTRKGYTPLVLTGQVGAGSRAHGDYTYRNDETGIWDSSEEFGCAATAAQQAPPPANAAETATVAGGDADVFNIAHNDVPDPANGVVGAKIGTLPNGTQVNLDGPCKAGWCRVNSNLVPQGFGFVEQGHLAFG